MSRIGRFFKKISKRTWYVIIAIVVILVGVRIALPYIVLNYLNKQFADMGEYTGHIEDIDISLIRGAYKIEGLVIEKKEGDPGAPFIEIPLMDLSVQWKALFQGAIVAEIEIYRSQINFVKGPTKEQSQSGEGGDWQEAVNSLLPIDINRLYIEDGKVSFLDFYKDPQVNIYASSLNLEINNLTNSARKSNEQPADVNLEGLMMNSAPMKLSGTIDPFNSEGTFDLNFEMDTLQLTKINNFLEGYIMADAEKGSISLYSELSAESGQLEGYMKPLVNNLVIFKIGDEEGDNFLKDLWEGVLELFTEPIENQFENQLGAEIPISGSLQDTDVHIVPTIGSLLYNALIRALAPTLNYDVGDQSIDIAGTPPSPEEADKKKKKDKDK